LKNKNELLDQIMDLSFKMRLLKERKSEGKFKLKDRDSLILEILNKHSGITPGEVGDYFRSISLSTISIDLKRLRKIGLVDKLIDSDDERKFCFRLTEEGIAQVKEARDFRAKMLKPVIDAIGDKPTEIKTISEFLKRTNEQIDLLSKQI